MQPLPVLLQVSTWIFWLYPKNSLCWDTATAESHHTTPNKRCVCFSAVLSLNNFYLTHYKCIYTRAHLPPAPSRSHTGKSHFLSYTQWVYHCIAASYGRQPDRITVFPTQNGCIIQKRAMQANPIFPTYYKGECHIDASSIQIHADTWSFPQYLFYSGSFPL